MSRTIEVKCWHCGKTFVAQRSSARYCNANCRKSYNRVKGKILNHAETAAWHLGEIAEQIQRTPQWTPYADGLLEWLANSAVKLRNKRVWRCETCGYKAFGRNAPANCKGCKKAAQQTIDSYPDVPWVI